MKKIQETWENGQIKMEYEINETGKKHGIYKTYTRDGNIFVEGQFVNGKRDGIWKQHNGDSVKEVKYINGEKIKNEN